MSFDNTDLDDVARNQRQGDFDSAELYRSSDSSAGNLDRSNQGADFVQEQFAADRAIDNNNTTITPETRVPDSDRYENENNGSGWSAGAGVGSGTGTGTGLGTGGSSDEDFVSRYSATNAGNGNDFDNKGMSGSGTGTSKPGLGDKMRGTAEKMAGKVTGDPALVAKGQERKGEFNASNI